MASVFSLLKPHLWSYRNRLLPPRHRGHRASREVLVLLALLAAGIGLYFINSSSIAEFQRFAEFDMQIAANFLRLCLLSFFFLVFFSSAIVAISALFLSQEIPLLISAPVLTRSLYLAKVVEITLISGWVCLFFSLPLVLALYINLDLPLSFLLASCGLSIPLLFIPSVLAITLVTILINIFPPQRMRELMIAIALLISAFLLVADKQSKHHMASQDESIGEMINYFSRNRAIEPQWFPTYWMSNILEKILTKSPEPFQQELALTFVCTLAVLALGYLVFDLLFKRGLTIHSQGTKAPPIRTNEFLALLGRMIFPFHPQLRALACKEAKMFLRDSTQSLQFMMLLLLTFIYLYNFESLYRHHTAEEDIAIWWKILLSLANIAFGACVLAAICSRFVYPSISLEGRAYPSIIITPLTIERFLFYKFLVWLLPISSIAVIVLVSGTLTIDGSLQAILSSAALAIAISIGICGLGIGVGAYYAKFDWDSVAQVTTNFGSMIYMLLALAVIGLSLIPASMLLILAGMPSFAEQLPAWDYAIGVTGSLALCLAINSIAARRAILAGAQHLRSLNGIS